MKCIDIKKKLAVIGLGLLTAIPAMAYDFATADSLRFMFDAEQGAAYLTYQALDVDNAEAYSGRLVVPAQVEAPQGTMPVRGITAVACVYCKDLQGVTLSEGIESIGYAAFSDCDALTEVTLPSSLTTLSDLSFYRDAHLKQVAVPASVKRVGAGAFGFCYDLEQASLDGGVRSIASNAFYHCSSLTQIELPTSVNQLGQYAFAYCTALQRIVVHGSPLAITEDVFEGLDRSQCVLAVPGNLIDAYASAPVWQDFQIVDNEDDALDEILADNASLMQVYVLDDKLHVCVLGDAPALVYDLQGHRLAVCPSASGDNALDLPAGHTYIIKCGRQSHKVSY